ncbi:AraC-like ligand-binding domain-containing protein [Actinomadura opuntiae]|uniref:AraC-like ligand-binding domain-containing protein n=1 Tax=Actinomadura sp. OS1-43 TaxID=604315 RepID=UPI00255B0AE9|nr:helix-turn-helix domain-containing protein [Actinomadura sp. OS1-43]MDL4817507.1 helix-turn-helix domain-containing protein [Actinomadura sp. OS1-43]
MPTLVSTSDHPARDQADYWRHAVREAFGPFHVRPARAGGFAARFAGRTLGPVEAGEVRAPAHEVRRGARQIARDTRECYKLGLVLRGSCVLRQNGRRVGAGPGDLVFYDLTRPVEIAFGAHRIFTVVVPHRAVPLPHGRMTELGGTLLSGEAGAGRLVASLLTALAEDADPADEPYAHHLGGAIVELLAGAAGERLGAGSVPPPSREQAEAVRAIKEWIEAHLHDPDLTPAAIAGAHHISVRQLYRVFEPAGTTVARYVRDRRLERCRRELADPLLAARRIGAIASRWGMPDAAGFSRAFRAAYGLPPSAYRARATGLRRAD